MKNILHPTIFKAYMLRNLSDYKGDELKKIEYAEENDEYIISYENRWLENAQIWISSYNLKYN